MSAVSGLSALYRSSNTGNVLHFWEIEESKIEKVRSGSIQAAPDLHSLQIKTTKLESVKSDITSLTIDNNRNVLLMGTKGGDALS